MTSWEPPGKTSSAGWKISRTRPPRSPARSNARATPSSTVRCRSWPQAWDTSGNVEENGSPVASRMGSASMSARSPTSRSPDPTSAMTPVPDGRTAALMPSASSMRMISAVVADSR